MPLEKICENKTNEMIFVLPVAGFGWSKTFQSESAEEQQIGIQPPLPFGVRISKFHLYRNEIRAVTGVVEHDGHPVDGMWAGLFVRDGGGEDFYNFTNKPTKHNVHLGRSEPVVEIGGPDVPMSEWIRLEGEMLSGMAYVAESQNHLAQVYERLK